ncbi:hypothetical protein [Rhodococcoides kyotonense]|uniref:Uncharacterized protein n=1 Tax=Rhodococcoides kyotonense TaxID=398843 RepID=A0A239N522_9NOCA|nr:hypothetical protein [Rhodococcus kyotonensis]SNT50117.1 hypothetical protein SAMN05421642_1302 [Rhodococcus kyotonensis]
MRNRAPRADHRSVRLRRPDSANLFCLGLTTVMYAAAWEALGDSVYWLMLSAATIPACFGALCIVMYRHGARDDPQGLRKSYALVFAASILALPFGLPVLTSHTGGITVLGTGFLVLGLRERSWQVCAAGVLAAAVGIVAAQAATNNYSASDAVFGIWSAPISVACLGIAILVGGTLTYVQETRKFVSAVGL